MSTKLSKEFDIQDYLINTEKDSKAFFKACIEEDPGDGSLARRALGELAKARGVVDDPRSRLTGFFCYPLAGAEFIVTLCPPAPS